MLIGYSQLVKDFKNLVAAGRLAHGYIFFGEPEVGKFYFAKHLANFLESGEFSIAERPFSDAFILENPSGIAEVRQIKNFLWQKPVVSPKRFVAINNAENLTPQAQNAILKITEEPPESAVVILIVNQLENLLPALVSRMQKIYFGRLNDEEMYKYFNMGTSDVQKIVNLSFGRPGRAKRLIKDTMTKEAENYAKGFLRKAGTARPQLIKELVEAQKENPELLDRFFESLILELRRDPVKNSLILKSVLHRLFLIKSYNVNKRLQLEAI